MLQQKTLRQQEIAEAARRIIFEKGVENLTVREIAKKMGVTDGALYRHFRSKNEILDLLIEDIEDSLLCVINEAADKSTDPITKLENIFFSHLNYAEKRKGITFILMASLKDKKMQRKMFGVISKYLNLIKSILRQGIDEGVFRIDIQLDSVSITFLGMIQGMVSVWGLSGYRYSLTKDRRIGMFNAFKRSIVVK